MHWYLYWCIHQTSMYINSTDTVLPITSTCNSVHNKRTQYAQNMYVYRCIHTVHLRVFVHRSTGIIQCMFWCISQNGAVNIAFVGFINSSIAPNRPKFTRNLFALLECCSCFLEQRNQLALVVHRIDFCSSAKTFSSDKYTWNRSCSSHLLKNIL